MSRRSRGRNPLKGKVAYEQQRAARFAAECYSDPEQFPSPDAYLVALTEVLDNLCETIGYPKPERLDRGLWA